jgi:hypothetical protein
LCFLCGKNRICKHYADELRCSNQYAFGRSCDRPTLSRFSVVFLGPAANAELVPKFHVALHASHVALPMLTSKFRPKVAPRINIIISPNTALLRLITKFKIVYERSKDPAVLLSLLHSSAYLFHFQTPDPH